MGGNNAPQEQNQAIGKQIKVLEHRLHRALVKFNEAIAANKELREEIDNLRRERVVFDGIYKKLQRRPKAHFGKMRTSQSCKSLIQNGQHGMKSNHWKGNKPRKKRRELNWKLISQQSMPPIKSS